MIDLPAGEMLKSRLKETKTMTKVINVDAAFSFCSPAKPLITLTPDLLRLI